MVFKTNQKGRCSEFAQKARVSWPVTSGPVGQCRDFRLTRFWCTALQAAKNRAPHASGIWCTRTASCQDLVRDLCGQPVTCCCCRFFALAGSNECSFSSLPSALMLLLMATVIRQLSCQKYRAKKPFLRSLLLPELYLNLCFVVSFLYSAANLLVMASLLLLLRIIPFECLNCLHSVLCQTLIHTQSCADLSLQEIQNLEFLKHTN